MTEIHKGGTNHHAGLASVLGGTMADIYSQAGRIGSDIQVLKEGAETLAAGGIVDDRTYTVGFSLLRLNTPVNPFLD